MCLMDHELVFGKVQEEHDRRLIHAFDQTEAANVTLNPSKFELSKVKVKFLGHVIDRHGFRADPDKRSNMPNGSSTLTYVDFSAWSISWEKFSPRIAKQSQLTSTGCSALNNDGTGHSN